MDGSTFPNLLNHQATGLAATAEAHPKSYLSVFVNYPNDIKPLNPMPLVFSQITIYQCVDG